MNKIPLNSNIVAISTHYRNSYSQAGVYMQLSYNEDFTGEVYMSNNSVDFEGLKSVVFVFTDVPVKHQLLYIRYFNNSSGTGDPLSISQNLKTSRDTQDSETGMFSANEWKTWNPYMAICASPNVFIPQTLKVNDFIKNDKKYLLTADGDADYSAITMEDYARAEIWMDYTSGKITWPSNLVWSTTTLVAIKNNEPYAVNGEPEWIENTRYFISLVNDSNRIVAKVTESYTLPAENTIVELDSNPVINESNEAESDENNGVEPESDLEDNTPSEEV